MTFQYDEEFLTIVRDFVESNEFDILTKRKHHIQTSVSDHVLRVAYLCYRHNKKNPKSKVDVQELIRSAMLHDFFFYDRYDKQTREFGRMQHVFRHPKIALNNAIGCYPDLTDNEKDAIKNHMFPLTITPPKTKCGWLICWYDKVAAIEDYMESIPLLNKFYHIS